MDETYNFKLIKVINTEKQLGSKIYIFEHERTGLKVYYCFPTDYVLGLKVSFYTPQINDKGITHVLEHLLCHTKSRYKNKWYLPSYSNEKTQFNAETFDDYTCFDLTSTSLPEFRTVVRSMFDSIFRKEFDFTEDQIAYEAGYIKDYDSCDGVIYNELKRVIEDPENLADEYSSLIAFSGTHYEDAPGGTLEGVMKITKEELEEYYFEHYHPSNCKIFVCGGFDIGKFLEYLDTVVFKDATRREVTKVPYEDPITLTDARLPFYAPNGYPKGENIYVWGIKLPFIENLDERAVYEVALRAVFDGGDGPFEEILKRGLAKYYKKTILVERVNAPYLRLTFFNVPEGAEETIDEIMNRYVDEIEYVGIDEDKFNNALKDVKNYYGPRTGLYYHSDLFNAVYYILKDDVYENTNLNRLLKLLNTLTVESISSLGAVMCSEGFQFKFVMYPSVDFVNDIEDNIIANYEDYKACFPVFEQYGERLAKTYKLNCTKQEVTKKVENLKYTLDKIQYELLKCKGVDVYKFEDATKLVMYAFDLRGLTDEELCFIPVLVKLINKKLPKRMDSFCYVDAEVVQRKVKDEYFKLELKVYFKDDIDTYFMDQIYDLIDNISPKEIAEMLLMSLPSKNNTSENLTRDLALRMDTNDLAYRGTVHRRTFFDALFNSANEDADRALNAFYDFHDACFKVLRRSNVKIVTTSEVLSPDRGSRMCEMLVDAIYDFVDVEQRKKIKTDDKDVTYHFVNARASATGVIKVEDLNKYSFGEKMVFDRMLYNFVYILFRQLGLGYQIDGTISGEYVTITSHSIRCCDDYRSAFAACGIYFEKFEGNLNHYKSKALDEVYDTFKGVQTPKINTFRYIESGISFEDIKQVPDVIDKMTVDDLREIGKSFVEACDNAKVYAVCGPGSHPLTLDDYELHKDYIFPSFLI